MRAVRSLVFLRFQPIWWVVSDLNLGRHKWFHMATQIQIFNPLYLRAVSDLTRTTEWFRISTRAIERFQVFNQSYLRARRF